MTDISLVLDAVDLLLLNFKKFNTCLIDYFKSETNQMNPKANLTCHISNFDFDPIGPYGYFLDRTTKKTAAICTTQQFAKCVFHSPKKLIEKSMRCQSEAADNPQYSEKRIQLHLALSIYVMS